MLIASKSVEGIGEDDALLLTVLQRDPYPLVPLSAGTVVPGLIETTSFQYPMAAEINSSATEAPATPGLTANHGI
jgi:hypothetical protein